jgi:hypothetical protein
MDGSGANESVNFMDVDYFLHINFSLDTWKYLICLTLVYGNIYQVLEHFPWKYFYGFSLQNTACSIYVSNLGVTGSNPRGEQQFTR